jgi:RNA polymerase sigma factor (sigma-70 family)
MTDGLLASGMAILPGHVQRHYGYIARAGNCILQYEDLLQVAYIELVRLVRAWDEIKPEGVGDDIDDERTRMTFMGYLRDRVKWEILKYSRDTTDGLASYSYASFDEPGAFDSDQTEAEVRTSLNLHVAPSITHADIADYFSTLPTRDKVILALRYFDELTYKEIAEIVGTTENSAAAFASKACDAVRAFARNQFVSDPTEIPHRRDAWEAPDTVTTYVRARWQREDLAEYLGVVTLCFRADVSYLVDIIGRTHVHVPKSQTSGRIRWELQDEIERRYDAGQTQAEIADAMGLAKSTVWNHVHRRMRA